MNILNKYPVFEKNQVLTSDQLNSLVTYLDQQNRLTRARLIGIGAICGFHVEYFPKDVHPYTDHTLMISKGLGITSNGFLITQGDCPTTRYRSYSLPKTVHYPPFEKIGSRDHDFKFYELLSTDADPGNDPEIHKLTAGFLSDKVVMLFLEIFDQDLKTCLAKSCDEIGQTRLFTLRKLLISITDLDILLKRWMVESYDPTFPEKFELPVISLKRITIKPEESAATSKLEMLKKYRDASLPVLGQLIAAIKQTNIVYQPVLEKLYKKDYFGVNQLIYKLSVIWEGYLTNESGAYPLYGMQYFYDFMKDLLLAWDEFKDTAFELCNECIIDLDRFPQHLMLGPAIPDKNYNIDATPYRNRFIQSPAYSRQKYLTDKTRSLHQRMVSLLIGFRLEYISTPDNTLSATYIIPSREKSSQLSERSIPFYYNPDVAELPLIRHWNSDIEKRKLSNHILTYHHQADTSDPVEAPLKFDLDDYPFLRIESVLGKEANVLQSTISTKKIDYNLPFNLVVLKTDPSPDTLTLDKALWNDLRESYLESSGKMICEVQSFYLNFSNLPVTTLKVEFTTIEPDKMGDLVGKIKEMLPGDFDQFIFPKLFESYCNLLELIHEYKLALLHYKAKQIHVLIDVIPNDKFQHELTIVEECLDIIRDILSSCTYRELYMLYYRLIGRKKYLLANHPAIFSNFLKKHPGLEHAGGVYKGGTFVMVNEDFTPSPDATGKNKVFAEFSLPYKCCCECCELPTIEQELENVRLPDLALPDSALCLVNDRVEIQILQNDLVNAKGEIYIITDSEFAGFDKIKRIINYERVNYEGFDSFNYTIERDIKSLGEVPGHGNLPIKKGRTNMAMVKVLMHNAYTPHIRAVDDLQIVQQHGEVEIDVLRNDVVYGTTKLTLADSASELGGEISIVDNAGKKIKFVSGNPGKDSFRYELRDEDRKEVSQATVTVLVTKYKLTVPDIVFLVTTGGTNSIPIDLPAGCKIYKVDSIPAGMGTLAINAQSPAIDFIPGTAFFASKTLNFSYVLVNIKDEPVRGIVHLIYSMNQGEDFKDYFDEIMTGSVMAFSFSDQDKKWSKEWFEKNGWLICDGSQYNRKQYARLFSRIDVTYGAGDGKVNFNVPDLRSQFLRGWENEKNERMVGSLQADQLQSHTHAESEKGHTHAATEHLHAQTGVFSSTTTIRAVLTDPNTTVITSRTSSPNTGPANISIRPAGVSLGNPVESKPGAGIPRHGDETRPQNMAVLFCIRY